VQAGRAGKFGFVVGVDRVGQADDLREAGADTVVTDLADLLGDGGDDGGGHGDGRGGHGGDKGDHA